MTGHVHVPPADCPVCGERLNITRLGCTACGTELSGRFAPCPYCSLAAQDRRVLRTFLISRGNMRELARELGVSYPTARQRFAELLVSLGLESADTDRRPAGGGSPGGMEDEGDGEAAVADRTEVLRRLAAGDLDLDEAEALLGGSGRFHPG
ncbi:MAG TPA: DUF2089 domain-containing protein [Jiangellaceae bacterium]|nr:DUF2089 domain-containing protein [Jiangellaceae bacterium]